MHETSHTYCFWAFGEKTPSLLFMLRKEKDPCFIKISMLHKEGSLLLWQGWWSCISRSLLCALAHFHFYEAFAEEQLRIRFSCHWCDMMYDVMLCKMMWWYDAKNDANAEDSHPHAHTETHNLCVPLGTIEVSLPFIFRFHRLFFGVSSTSP